MVSTTRWRNAWNSSPCCNDELAWFHQCQWTSSDDFNEKGRDPGSATHERMLYVHSPFCLEPNERASLVNRPVRRQLEDGRYWRDGKIPTTTPTPTPTPTPTRRSTTGQIGKRVSELSPSQSLRIRPTTMMTPGPPACAQIHEWKAPRTIGTNNEE